MRISDWSSDVCSSDLALARVHQVEALVDLVQRQDVGDHRVDLDLAIHVPVDDLGHVCAAPGAAEGGALPHATGDELERAGGDFLARFGDADDDAFTPAAVAAFERGAHHFGITGQIGRASCRERGCQYV